MHLKQTGSGRRRAAEAADGSPQDPVSKSLQDIHFISSTHFPRGLGVLLLFDSSHQRKILGEKLKIDHVLVISFFFFFFFFLANQKGKK